MPLIGNLGSGIWEVRSKLPKGSREHYFSCTKTKSFCSTDSSRKREKTP
jgi:hypothetical protein